MEVILLGTERILNRDTESFSRKTKQNTLVSTQQQSLGAKLSTGCVHLPDLHWEPVNSGALCCVKPV